MLPRPRLTSTAWVSGCPGLVISPYAKENYIDHNTYSFESWLKIVEERFDVHPMTARDTNALICSMLSILINNPALR